MIGDLLNFTGTLFVPRVHWFWMLVALALGCRVGWSLAAEPRPRSPAGGEDGET